MTSFLATIEAAIQKDEQWVVNEIAVGWKALQKTEKTIAVDVINLFKWIQAHHQDILTLFTGALKDLEAIGGIFPMGAPVVAAATTAIDAATAAIDVLSKGITIGSTPLSTITNAYHAVKDAQSAVNNALKSGTTKPVATTTQSNA